MDRKESCCPFLTKLVTDVLQTLNRLQYFCPILDFSTLPSYELLILQVDQYTRSCDIIQASMKRHLKRYFTNGLNTDTAYENKISSSSSDIRGSITEVELVMNNYRGCSGLNKNPVEFMDEHCKQYILDIYILLPKLF